MLPDKPKRSWQDVAAEIASKNPSSEIASLVDELLHSLDEARRSPQGNKACDQRKAS